MSGFRFDTSDKAAGALLESGWREGPAFDADCGDCEGTGDNAAGEQCPCGGILWIPPAREGGAP